MATVLYFFLSLFSVCLAGSKQIQCDFCMSTSCTPSISGIPAASFKPSNDAKDLRKAMQGLYTNKNKLINILTSRTDCQRESIAESYLKLGGNTLVKDIEGATYFSLRKFLTRLVTPLLTFYTEELHHAIQNKKRYVINEILTTLPSCVIRKISANYLELFKSTLTSDLEDFKDSLLSSKKNYISVIKSLAQGDREPFTTVNKSKAKKDALRLKEAGVEALFLTDKKVFVEIFTKQPIPQLREIINQYEEIRRKEDEDFVSLEKDIEEEFSTSAKEIYVSIIRNVVDQPLYFAQELEEALDMWHTSKVTRIIRGRSDIDLQNIKRAYFSHYKKSLVDRIKEKTVIWPNYKKVVLAVVNENT